MHRILVLEPEYFDDDSLGILRKAGSLTVKRMSKQRLGKEIAKFDAVVVRIETKLDSEVLERAPGLKVIGTATTGLDHIDVEYAKAHGIKIVSLHGAHTIPAAEHTFALMLSLTRKIPWAYNSLSRGTWKRYKFIGTQLDGKTLGIIGLGRIGSAVARYAKAFGMNVVYYDPYVDSSELARKVSMEELLEVSDVVSLHAALTQEDRHVIGKEHLHMMKKGAILINTARGEIVDSHALIEALKEGTISGAAIDVFPKEPLTGRDDPVIAYARRHTNLIITPHIGASTMEAVHEAGIETAKAVVHEFESMDK